MWKTFGVSSLEPPQNGRIVVLMPPEASCGTVLYKSDMDVAETETDPNKNAVETREMS